MKSYGDSAKIAINTLNPQPGQLSYIEETGLDGDGNSLDGSGGDQHQGGSAGGGGMFIRVGYGAGSQDYFCQSSNIDETILCTQL